VPHLSGSQTEPSDVRFLVAGMRLGAVITLVVCLSGAAYYAETWQEANRSLLVGLSGVFALGSLAMLTGPVVRVAAGPRRWAFMLGWSFASIAGMAGCLYLDGGGRTPTAFGLALPLAFSGLMYPLRGAIAVAIVDIAAFVAVNLARPYNGAELIFATAILASMAVLCVWTASWQNRQRAELARLSRTDPLTGCLNRRGVEAQVRRALASERGFALVTLDLDDLKSVNDHDGHAAGDAVLCSAVRLLHEAVRPTDFVGRLGGDEFAILLPGASPEVASRVRERASLALSFAAPASFGLAVHPRDGATADALFRHADAEVYREKSRRRGIGYGAARSESG
jgi:diguanylate cyclase (GGDEF)-like protein